MLKIIKNVIIQLSEQLSEILKVVYILSYLLLTLVTLFLLVIFPFQDVGDYLTLSIFFWLFLHLNLDWIKF
jgi:hypothetical protein